jgi:hypothetical protein
VNPGSRGAEIPHEAIQRGLALEILAIMISRYRENWQRVMLVWLIELSIVARDLAVEVDAVAD